MRGLIRVFERSHLRLGWSIILSLRCFQSHVVRASDVRAMMRTTIFGSSILSPPRKNEPRRRSESRSVASARVSCRRALFRERERDFSPTNQLCTFLFEAFGKKTHPPRHNERNDTSENNNALNNLFSFSQHRKQPPRFRRRRRRRRKREREGPERRGFSVRFLIVQSSSRRRRRKDASASAEKPEKKREYDAENIPPVRARFAPKHVAIFRKRRQRRSVVVVVERW